MLVCTGLKDATGWDIYLGDFVVNKAIPSTWGRVVKYGNDICVRTDSGAILDLNESSARGWCTQCNQV